MSAFSAKGGMRSILDVISEARIRQAKEIIAKTCIGFKAMKQAGQ
jgi:hypothetical protein